MADITSSPARNAKQNAARNERETSQDTAEPRKTRELAFGELGAATEIGLVGAKTGQIAVLDDANHRELEPIGRNGGMLLTPWRPGQSGNPRGRQSAGLSVVEWYNQMKDYTDDQIDAVIADRNAPKLKRAAARRYRRADSELTNDKGDLIAGMELDAICDRTDGKPLARQQVNVNETLQSVVVHIVGDGRQYTIGSGVKAEEHKG